MLRKIFLLVLCVGLAVVFVAPVETSANALSPVDVFVKDQNTTYVTLEWSRDMNVDGYEIYRSNTMTNDFKRIATVDHWGHNIFQTKNPKARTFRYKVRAYKVVKNKRVYGSFGQELVVSTKGLEASTLGRYFDKKKYLNYCFYNVGKDEGYNLYVSKLSKDKYKVMMCKWCPSTEFNNIGWREYELQVKEV